MDNYIVSARKYRPATFSSVVGQRALTTTLKNAIATGKLAHAYLFCGPRGVGKTTCARIFAKTINCQHLNEQGEACNECESCQAFNEGRSLNIHELDAASNNSVEDIRLLIEQVAVPPQVGRYKVFIIDEVHMLSQAAFNAFLKTLEEPPAHAVFILATTEKHKILPTILSRCQIYDFGRMEIADIIGHLKQVAEAEHITYEEEALAVIARKADGGMRDAMSIFDQVAGFSNGDITYKKVVEDLNILDYDYYFEVTDALLKPDIPAALLLLNEILSKGFEGNHFISGLASHFRDLLVSRDEQTLPLLEVADVVRERYREQAKRCPLPFLYRSLKLCNACDIHYRTSSSARLLVELTLIEIAQGDGDDESCGLCPTIHSLRPLFAHQQSAAAVASPSSTPSPQKTSRPAPAAPAPAAPTAAAPAPGGLPPHTPPASASAATAPRSVVRRTMSIRKRVAEPSTAAAASAGQAAPQGAVLTEPFEKKDLSYNWYRFAASLPHEQAAMAGRMKTIDPQILDNWVIDVPVENEQVVQFMEQLRAPLTAYLREQLRNSLVTLQFRVIAETEKKRAYSRREQYAMMIENNASLALLAKVFELELA